MRERTLALEHANAELERDIARRQQLEHSLRTAATTDALTGLANRAYVMPHAQHRIDLARPAGTRVVLMLFDLDGFKHVNDTHGHAVGDEVLRRVADRVRAVCRGSDVLARLGGDEFLLVAEGIDGLEQPRRLAGRIAELFDLPFEVDTMSLPLGVSIGVAVFPDHGDDLDVTLAAADAAMYIAKRRGGGVALAGTDALPTTGRGEVVSTAG